ncbi:EthD family reductase [Tsuneonella sp. HG094]
MFLVSAVYPEDGQARFDEIYYLGPHRELVSGLLEPFGLTSMRLVKGVSALDGGAAPFRMLAEMHFASREGFDQGMAVHGAEIMGDAANYTDIQPILQVGEILVA